MAGSKIRVAVIGGGLGGTILMNSLLQYPHIDPHIYEAKDTFKERGASVGLAPNAQRALRLMGLGHVMKGAGAVNVHGGQFVVGEGPEEGEVVAALEGGLATVHRAALLRELVDPIPAERMHINKKLTGIDGDTITFDDGTTAIADVIIGADGIHSSVRQYVLGKDHPNLAPVNSGIFDFRCLLSLEDAVAALGAERINPEEPKQVLYCGNDGILFFDFIDDIKTVCIVACLVGPPEGFDKTKWLQMVSREWLYDRYKTWPPYAKKMVDLLCGDQTEIPAFVEWESGAATQLHKGNMCIIGDAAHATTPYQGAGLGQAIEDALIVQAALGKCKSISDVPVAFKAYDELMRPRGRRVVESSRRVGLITMGELGLDAGKMKAALASAWDFIHGWDTEAAVTGIEKAVVMARTENAAQ